MRARLVWPVLIGILVVPTAALARPGDAYFKAGGPRQDVPRKVKSPSGLRFCNRGKIAKDAAQKAQCEDGIRAARRTAQDQAASRGLEAGYLQGFTFGLHKGLRKASHDPETAEKAEQDALASDKLTAAVEAARKKATEQGGKQGGDEVTALFTEAFNEQRMPHTKLALSRVNVPDYALVEDPATEFYGAEPKVEDVLQRAAKQPNLTIPGNVSRSYFEGKTYPVLDAFREDGNHAFEYADVVSPDTGWKLYTASTTTESGDAPARTEAFEKAFRRAYETCAVYEFSSMFYRSLDVGAADGMALGTETGKQVLYVTTGRKTLAKAYRKQVPTTFTEAFRTAYQTAWEKEVDRRQTTPILEIANLQLVDDVADGVVSPGEPVRVKFDVANRGLKATSLAVFIEGAVVDTSEKQVKVAGFKKQSLESDVVAQVDPKLYPRKEATLTIHVGDQQAQVPFTVRQVVEIDQVELDDLAPAEGRGSLHVVLVNPTTRKSRSTKVVVRAEDQTIANEHVASLDPGETRDVAVAFEKIDPLALMKGLPTELELSRSDTVLQSWKYEVQPDQSDSVLLHYFDLLAYGDGYVPKGTKLDEQIERARSLILERGRVDIKSHQGKWRNIWKVDARSTMVGRVIENFETASEEAKPHYNALLDNMCRLTTEFSGMHFRKRSAYQALCTRARAVHSNPAPAPDTAVPTEEPPKDGTEPVAKKEQ